MDEWLPQLRSAIAVALRWWVGELTGLIPWRLQQRLARRRSRLLLIAEANVATLAYEAGERLEIVRRFATAEGHFKEIQQAGDFTSSAGRSGDAVVVRLPADRALRSEMVLPMAALRNIDQVIAFEFERHTPFRREDVYFAYRLLKRDPKLRQLRIELTCVVRPVVQEALRLAQQIGLRVETVEVAGAEDGPGFSANLLRDELRPSKKRPSDLALGGVATAAAILAIVAAVTPVIEATATEEKLSRQVEESKRRAETSQQLRNDIDAEIRGRDALIARKRQIPSATEILDTLTRLIPDDNWLTTLAITSSSVQLAGFATSSTTLLRLIDQTPGFSDAAFRASVNQSPNMNREQFDITAKIVTRSGG